MLRYLIIFLLTVSIGVQAVQAQDQGVVDPPEEETEADDNEEPAMEPVVEEEVVISPLTPMNFPDMASYETVATDSLLRWGLWQNPAEWRHYDTGTISYRLGGFGRNDGMILKGHEPRHQKVYHEGILFNDRVSGSMNTNRMPHHRFARVYERSQSITHVTSYQNRRYYLNKPLTMISYDQGQVNQRSTEGLFSRNIGRETNLELTYWGKNDDGLYMNNELSGRKASGRVFHHINERFIAEGGVLYNGLQLGEPNGYQIFDMYQFAFNRFNASPVESQARSSVRNTVLYSSVLFRPDEESDVSSRLSAYHNNYRRFYYGSADSTYYDVSTNGLHASHSVQEGPLSLQVNLNADHSGVSGDSNRSLERSSWTTYTGRAEGEFDLEFASLSGWSNIASRSDGYRDYELGGLVTIDLPFGLGAHASYAMGDQMPTIQQLYWRSNLHFGNPGLNNESLTRAEAGVELRPLEEITVGAQVHSKNIRNPIMMGMDSTFTQTGSYRTEGAEMFANLDVSRFEAEVSLTYQHYMSDSQMLLDRNLAESGSRVWGRASAYYKGYVFDSAAYVKAGGSVLFSPNPYRSGTYYPQMDYWDSNSFEQNIPEFHRFDLEVSARVRTVMVLMRLENVLDQVTQLGYFETADHPMPGRVFRFGIKWILRN